MAQFAGVRSAELHGLAIEYHCPIIGIIHTDPITSRGQVDKTRGHLGSQLERKSEPNLKLEKTGETTQVWSNKQRKAPIAKEYGPVFKWSDQQGMHVSCDLSEKEPSKADQDIWFLADEVFSEKDSLTYKELGEEINRARGVATANRRIARMRDLEIVTINNGFYRPVTPKKDDQ